MPVLLILLAFTTVYYRYYDISTTGRTAAALADGSAEYYWQQQVDRLPLLEDPTVTDVVLEPLDVPANLDELLFNGDLKEDPAIWVNRAVANFYHKTTVRISP